MTPTDITAALKTIGWTANEFARRVGVNERQTRRWRSGEYPLPEPLAVWLADLAHYHARHPAPPREYSAHLTLVGR